MDVTEPIRFGGLGSSESLALKVYEPDRRWASDGGPPLGPVSALAPFAWAGTTCRLGMFDRPGSRSRWI
jgi:hypothetical protein